MPSMVVWLLSAALAHTPTPERVVLWTDATPVSHEQALVRHMLMQTLAADARLQVVSNTQLMQSESRAAALRTAVDRQLRAAQSALEELHVDRAREMASRARQKAERVALLSGDPLPLVASLELLAAALLLEQEVAAEAVLEELLLLAPDWRPTSSFFHPDAAGRIAVLRQRLADGPRRPLALSASAADAALFVDGVRVGVGRASLPLHSGLPHLFWALSPDGAHAAAHFVVGEAGNEPVCVHLALGSGGRTPDLPPARLTSALAASRSQRLGVELDDQRLQAMGVQRVLVLEQQRGELVLTHLVPSPPQRWRVRTNAADVTTLQAAQAAARQLLAEPPPLEPALAPVLASPPAP